MELGALCQEVIIFRIPDFTALRLRWEFPKIGDPNLVPYNSRILIIRTPKIRYPHFRKLPGPFLLRSLGLKHAYRTSTKVGNPIASIPKSDV